MDRVSLTLARLDDDKLKSKQRLFGEWTDEVFHPIQRQIADHFRTKGVAASFKQANVVSGISDVPFRARIDSKRDPTKRALSERQREIHISDSIDTVLGISLPLHPSSRARNSLSPECWSRTRYTATPEGIAARILEPRDGVRTCVHLNCTLPADGCTTPAGMKRFGNLGIFEGTIATRGEAAQRSSPSGGAPCQDHCGFSTDIATVDREFPRGRRVFPTPSFLKRNPLLLSC